MMILRLASDQPGRQSKKVNPAARSHTRAHFICSPFEAETRETDDNKRRRNAEPFRLCTQLNSGE